MATHAHQHHTIDDSAQGLMVRLGDTLHEVQELSVGGLWVDRVDAPLGAKVPMTLFPREGHHLELSQTMTTRGEVAGHDGDATCIRFVGLTFPLARFVIQQLARQSGVQPYIFR